MRLDIQWVPSILYPTNTHKQSAACFVCARGYFGKQTWFPVLDWLLGINQPWWITPGIRLHPATWTKLHVLLELSVYGFLHTGYLRSMVVMTYLGKVSWLLATLEPEIPTSEIRRGIRRVWWIQSGTVVYNILDTWYHAPTRNRLNKPWRFNA